MRARDRIVTFRPMTAPSITDLASACVAAVRNALGIELDYTQDTLPLLDHYASQANGPREEILGLVAPMCGAYFGEVLRRNVADARWIAPDDDYALWRLEFEPCFLYLNPVGLAVESLMQRETAGMGSRLGVLDQDRKALEASLERYGEVDEADYFRLSIRYEVIEQAVITLVARSRERGEDPTSFGPDVYADFIASHTPPEALPN
jgi:hypothetical protein